MRLARVLGAIGRGLISAGVIVLLFVAYQLWGTGIQNRAAQSGLENEFEERLGIEVATDAEALEAAALASQQDIEAGQIVIGADDVDDVDDGSEPDVDGGTDSGPRAVAEAGAADLFEANFSASERQDILAKLYPEPGEPLARIQIPAINVDQITVEGVSVEDLRKGPGHYRTTPNPGQAGNAAIAGHRTTYGAPFHRVDELDPGDSIFVTTPQGTFHYRVLGFDDPGGGPQRGHFIVSPSDTWVLDQKPDENILTLTACHPKYSARQRIIVQAELVGEPAPTIPRDEAVELDAVTLDSGAADERAAGAEAVEGDAVASDEEGQIISDEVAADDDPSVDADGNPIEAEDAVAEDTAGDSGTDSGEGEPNAATGGDADGDPESSDAAGASESADDLENVVVETATDDAELTSAQTPLTTDDFGEGLNGDPTKVRPAIMWGIAGLFIWIAAWFMGKRFDRKWTLYAVGLVPFVFVLWSTFVNVDQALPSY